MGPLSDSSKLPLFPLNTVLYPMATLNVHVFEGRYRLMIGRCLEMGSSFGVALIRAGVEAGAPAIPHRVGTEATIRTVERLEDGRMNLTVKGARRFRLVELDPSGPYLMGKVEWLNDAEEPAGTLGNLQEAVWYLMREALQIEGLEPGGSLTQDPRGIQPRPYSFVVGEILPLQLEQKQRLLEMASEAERLKVLLKMLMAVAGERGVSGNS